MFFIQTGLWGRTDTTQSGENTPLRKMYFFVLSLIETSGIPMHVALLCLKPIPKFYIGWRG